LRKSRDGRKGRKRFRLSIHGKEDRKEREKFRLVYHITRSQADME